MNISGYAELMNLPSQHSGSYELLGRFIEPIKSMEGISPEIKARISTQVQDNDEATQLGEYIASSHMPENKKVASAVNTASVLTAQTTIGAMTYAVMKTATRDDILSSFYGMLTGVIGGMVTSKTVEIPMRMVSDLFQKRKQDKDTQKFLDCELGQQK